MDINSTSLARAAAIIAPALGLSLPEDRAEVIMGVNKYRNLLYNLYPEVKLFDNYKVCCCVQNFTQNCMGTGCETTYYGITLPDDMASIVSAWEYNEPLNLRSRWRESHTGIHTGNSPHMELVEMPEVSATERELTYASKLKIFTYDERDNGKVVVIKGKDSNFKPLEVVMTLECDAFVESKSLFCRIDSVVLPDLCNRIELRSDDDCTLSVYYPHEHVPKYRRYKLNTPCSTPYILVQGARNYQDLIADTDVVEIGDRLILEAAGRYFRYSENSTDKEDIARAEYDLDKMKDLVNGVVDRHRGRSVQDRSPVSRARRGTIRSGLKGYGRHY